MKDIHEVMLIAGIIIVLLIVIIVVAGYSLPVGHTATISETINAPLNAVWEKISQPSTFNTWRKGIKAVEIISPDEWLEVDKYGKKLPIKVVSTTPPYSLSTMINSTNLPFGGEWHYQLKPVNDATEITIREDGKVYNPVFRFLSKFVMGHTYTIKQYLKELKSSFM